MEGLSSGNLTELWKITVGIDRNSGFFQPKHSDFPVRYLTVVITISGMGIAGRGGHGNRQDCLTMTASVVPLGTVGQDLNRFKSEWFRKFRWRNHQK